MVISNRKSVAFVLLPLISFVAYFYSNEIYVTVDAIISDYPDYLYFLSAYTFIDYFIYDLNCSFCEHFKWFTWIDQLHDVINDQLHWNQSLLTNEVNTCSIECYDNQTYKFTSNNVQLCDTMPLYLLDPEVIGTKRTKSFAERTTPCAFELTKSKIPNAGRGIFARHRLPKGLLFGPYKGIRMTKTEDPTKPRIRKDYSWNVGMTYNIDGLDTTVANWLRYINCARYEEEQNMMFVYLNGTVYYFLYKDVKPGDELLVYYGEAFAKFLGLRLLPRTEHLYDWHSYFSPPRNITHCPSCDNNVPKDSHESNRLRNEEITNNNR